MEKLLIVDDEIEILEWLEELFTYDFARALEVHTASSAGKALELLDRVSFDVVLTDIKMPGMDGMMLFEKIKENWPECKVIFLTGYRSFEDIYKVNRHRDVRYVLKSEDDDVITKAVEEAFAELEARAEQKRLWEMQQDYVEKARYWMKRDFLNKLLHMPEALQECLEEQKNLGIAFDFQEKMLLFLIRMDERQGSEEENCLLLEEYGRQIRERLPGWIRAEENIVEKRYLLLMLQPKDKDGHQWKRIFTVAQGAMEAVQRICEIQGRAGFSAVISSTERTLFEGREALGRLKRIMAGCLGGMKGAVVHAEKSEEFYEQIKPENERSINFGLLKHYLEMHQREPYFVLLNEICGLLSAGRGRHDMQAMEVYFNTSTILLQFINDNRLQEALAFKIGLYKLLNVDEHGDWTEAGEYLTLLSEEIFHILGDYENTLSERALKRITEYIESHIDGDLSLTNLAQIGGFNASYLSRLFKQIHSETLSDYVLKKRMELAKRLLADTRDRIQDVSERTGYTSSNSFSRAFRGYTGLSPVEYRELQKTVK